MTSAIILAGGLGTRLRSAVPDLPKPMAPLKGRPFLEYQLDYWIAQGVRHFILSIGYRSEIIRSHFGHIYRNARLDYAEESHPLGTGGGLTLAMEQLDNAAPFLLLNGDSYFEVDLEQLSAYHAKMNSDWTMALFRTHEIGRYMGPTIDSEGRIIALKSQVAHGEHLANGGVYLINPCIFSRSRPGNGMKISLEDEIMPTLLAAGRRFFGIHCNGNFIDIGIPEDYLRAETLITGDGVI